MDDRVSGLRHGKSRTLTRYERDAIAYAPHWFRNEDLAVRFGVPVWRAGQIRSGTRAKSGGYGGR